MRYLVGVITAGGNISWQDTSALGGHLEEQGLTINFPIHGSISQYEAQRILVQDLTQNGIDWLYKKQQGWFIHADRFKSAMPEYNSEAWLGGVIPLEPELERESYEVLERSREIIHFRFVITPEMVQNQMSKRIFLSHAGVDKPRVRKFKSALEAVGLRPWLDEDAMHAGVELERGLLRGFKESCAAVFFITPNFQDERYLGTEVEYAVAERRERGNRFNIISILFVDADGKRGQVPSLLRRYVWKQPDDDLDAFAEIIKALPINVGDVGWRE